MQEGQRKHALVAAQERAMHLEILLTDERGLNKCLRKKVALQQQKLELKGERLGLEIERRVEAYQVLKKSFYVVCSESFKNAAAKERASAEVGQLQAAQKVLEASIADLEQQVKAAQANSTEKSLELEELKKWVPRDKIEAWQAHCLLADQAREPGDLRGRLEPTTLEPPPAGPAPVDTANLESESAAAEAAKGAATAPERESNRSKVRSLHQGRYLLATCSFQLTGTSIRCHIE